MELWPPKAIEKSESWQKRSFGGAFRRGAGRRRFPYQLPLRSMSHASISSISSISIWHCLYNTLYKFAFTCGASRVASRIRVSASSEQSESEPDY
jgi:hypothetical protein